MPFGNCVCVVSSDGRAVRFYFTNEQKSEYFDDICVPVQLIYEFSKFSCSSVTTQIWAMG